MKKLMRKKLALMLANLKKKRPFYTEVEYLESTGTQWFDIGTTIDTSTDEIEIYFQLTETNKYKWFFGEYDDNNRLGLGSGDGTNLRNFLYKTTVVKINDVDMYNSQHHYLINSNGAFLDGVKKVNYASFSSTLTLYLFNLNINSTIDYRCSCKIWAYRQKRNGVLIRELIPVLDWDMTPCMYDKVSRQLFYNQGTGTFSYGREIHYVDYLESTGTQYIDTGIHPTDDYGYRIKNTYTAGAGEQCAIGCMDSGNRFVGVYTSGSSNGISGAWGSYVGFLPSYPWTTGTILDVKCNYKNSRKITIDDTEVKDISDIHITGTISNSIYIGARHYGLTVTKMQGRIYGAEITNGQNTVADFYPAIDENGVGFMFDRITHTCYLNAGTGVFKYPVRETEYIEVTDLGSTNNRPCLNLGLKYKSSMSIEGKYTRTAQGDSGSVLPLSNNTTNPLIYFPALDAGSMKDRFVWRRSGYTEQRKDKTFNSYPVTTEFKLDAVNDILYIDGEVAKTGMIAGMGGYTSPYESSSSLYMLSIDGTYGGMGKVYPLKIYDTEQVYRDLVPAFKDGSVGMYDKENDVLYTNTKEGTIIGGKIVEPEYE